MKRHWTLGLAAALGGHGVVLAAMMAVHTLVPPPKPVAAAIMIELPPAAPPRPPAPALEQPPPPQAKPKAAKPRQTKAVAPPLAPPSAPPSAPEPETAAEPATAPPQASVAAAPVRTAANPQAAPNWQSRMLAHLERHKLYPAQAQRRHLRGVAVLTFTMDRAGRVLSQSLRDSSGHALLDQAALDMLVRAQPLPPPPPEVEGAMLTLSVPVKFTLN